MGERNLGGAHVRRTGGRGGAAAKPFCAHNHTTKSGEELCGAQITADEGANWRAKVMLAPSTIGERTFAKELGASGASW